MLQVFRFWRSAEATMQAWLAADGGDAGEQARPRMRWVIAALSLALESALIVAVCAVALMWAFSLPVVATLLVAALAWGCFVMLALARLAGVPWLLRAQPGRRLRRARALVTLAVATTALPLVVLALALSLVASAGLSVAVFAAVAVLAVAGLVATARHAFVVQHGAVAVPAYRFWVSVAVEALLTVVLLAVVIWGLGRAAFPLYQVPSGSMWPTLVAGDVILVDRTAAWRGAAGLARFDLVVFEHPGYPDRIVKRVVAFGGETVELRGGTVWVNGEPAPRPAAVQQEQLQREAILDAAPRRETVGERDPELAARHAFEDRFTLWHGGPVQRELPDEVAQHTVLVEAPAEGASSLAAAAWREGGSRSPRYVLDADERSLWQLSAPGATVVDGYDLGYLDGHGPIRSRLVVRHSMQDPALRHMRVYWPAQHLAVELELERLGDSPELAGHVTVGIRAETAEGQALEHHYQLNVPRAQDAVTLGGRMLRFDDDGGVADKISVEPHAFAAWPVDDGARPLRLRVHTVDGRFDAWCNERRVPGASQRRSLALPAQADDVVVWLESDVPIRVTQMRITAATSYLPTGPLREPLIVPEGKLVMLGDHTHASTDSREWEMVEYRWPDGRIERVAILDDAYVTTSATATVPRDDLPAILLKEQWPDEIPEPLTITTRRLDRGGSFVDRDDIILYWHEAAMHPDEEAFLRGLSPASTWQAALDELKAQAGTLPRRLGLRPAPFIAETNLTGRVLAVLSPAERRRHVR